MRLDRALGADTGAASAQPSAHDAGSGGPKGSPSWVMVERQLRGVDKDMQRLLRNMAAHRSGL